MNSFTKFLGNAGLAATAFTSLANAQGPEVVVPQRGAQVQLNQEKAPAPPLEEDFLPPKLNPPGSLRDDVLPELHSKPTAPERSRPEGTTYDGRYSGPPEDAIVIPDGSRRQGNHSLPPQYVQPFYGAPVYQQPYLYQAAPFCQVPPFQIVPPHCDPFVKENAQANDRLLENARQGVENQLRGIEQKLGIPTIDLKTVLGPETPAKNKALLERLQLIIDFIAAQNGQEALKLSAQPTRLKTYEHFYLHASKLLDLPAVNFERSSPGKPGVVWQSVVRADVDKFKAALMTINDKLGSTTTEVPALPKGGPSKNTTPPLDSNPSEPVVPPAPSAENESRSGSDTIVGKVVTRKKSLFRPPTELELGRLRGHGIITPSNVRPSTNESEVPPEQRPAIPPRNKGDHPSNYNAPIAREDWKNIRF